MLSRKNDLLKYKQIFSVNVQRLSQGAMSLAVVASILTNMIPQTALAAIISGTVFDESGNPLEGIQLRYKRNGNEAGANSITVFSDQTGHFKFPENLLVEANVEQLQASSLNYSEYERSLIEINDGVELVITMQDSTNQAEQAPASAWLQRIKNPADKADFVMNCIDCHQVPSLEVRNFAAMIDSQETPDKNASRKKSWDAIVKYMNYLSAWEFSRGARKEYEKIDTDAVYSVQNSAEVIKVLTSTFNDDLQNLSGYSYGAPLLSTVDTTVWEYLIDEPNAIREAVMLGSPPQLYVADVGNNRVIGVDVATGKQTSHEVPTDYLIGPHSLHRGADNTLWVTPLFNDTVAQFDPVTNNWQTWQLKTPTGGGVGIHDLSFGADHELMFDEQGRIWFSDIGNSSVGYFDPKSSKTEIWKTPIAESRAQDTALYGTSSVYGLAMSSNHQEIWYSQLGNGVFGGFDIVKKVFIGPFVLPSENAGPRRLTITEDDILYLALYGTGQLAEFDTKSRTMINIYDLPDTGAAPYAATWDTVRKVVWIATANGNVIYKFEPESKEFSVLPLPQPGGFLRMIDIDPTTGVLITSYANIVENVNGPRSVLIIEPGDQVYSERFVTQSESNAESLLMTNHCYACHLQEQVSIGPPWLAIKARYQNNPSSKNQMINKIINGGVGEWGEVPMVPNQRISSQEAAVVVDWILDQ